MNITIYLILHEIPEIIVSISLKVWDFCLGMSDISVDLDVAEKYHIFGIQKGWDMFITVSKLLLTLKLMVQIMPLKNNIITIR